MPILEGLGIAEFFAQVAGGDGPSPESRRPELPIHVLEEGIAPSVALMVGDSPTDVQPPAPPGLRPRCVTYGSGRGCPGGKTDFVIDTFSEMLELVCS